MNISAQNILSSLTVASSWKGTEHKPCKGIILSNQNFNILLQTYVLPMLASFILPHFNPNLRF